MEYAVNSYAEIKRLLSKNHPSYFWRCLMPISNEEWDEAIRTSSKILTGDERFFCSGAEDVIEYSLGEGYRGLQRWRLSPIHQILYLARPYIPQSLVAFLRRLYHRRPKPTFPLLWPKEDRYARFLWATMHQVLIRRGVKAAQHLDFWPHGKHFALVLTHDVETRMGHDFVRKLVALEESYGFRSSFNFVPERYRVDSSLLVELKERGFEIGVHGLRHDGRLYASRKIFNERARMINRYLSQWGAVGFRSPLTHRQPEWMQALEIEYDSSFCDTDPYETLAGGTMSLWPFFIGRFVELPYTLPQDHTLMITLGEVTPRIWLEKVEFIAQFSGMALSITHPDYLHEPGRLNIYEQFLQTMSQRKDYWHALPRDVACWWRNRAQFQPTWRDGVPDLSNLSGATLTDVHVTDITHFDMRNT